MNRLLHGLLRPSVYGAIILGASTMGVTFTHQYEQRMQARPMFSQARKTQQRTIQAASTLASSLIPKNHREERYLEFSSVEYEGIPYMTPADFLESVTQDKPRHRQKRKILSKQELDRRLKNAPQRKLASTSLLRNLGQDGIISYPEYLFLLCTLANPKSGFMIAFNMIDRGRNKSVTKVEFATMNANVSRWEGGDEAIALQDTTLMRYFFGRSGKKTLEYGDFATFISNLQDEVLEIEFLEFSNGMPTIAESDFARVLLRYTNLSEQAQEQYAQQIKEKLVRDKGIGYEEFRQFFQFINSLQDLATALRMYALAGHSVTQEEFQRAVKACVGYTLAPRVVHTVFLLFDKDGDGSLSSDEFLSILRDRLRRLNPKPRGVDTLHGEFKKCLKREIKREA